MSWVRVWSLHYSLFFRYQHGKIIFLTKEWNHSTTSYDVCINHSQWDHDKGRYYMFIIQCSTYVYQLSMSTWQEHYIEIFIFLEIHFRKCSGSEIHLSNIWPFLMFATIISISYKYCLFFWHLPISNKLYDGIVLLQRYRLFFSKKA